MAARPTSRTDSEEIAMRFIYLLGMFGPVLVIAAYFLAR